MCQPILSSNNSLSGHSRRFGKIGTHKTRVHQDSAGRTEVVYHSTPVVAFDDQQIRLNSGGWWTRTTKVRMNQASEEFGLGYRVFQKKHEWFVDYKNAVLAFTTDQVLLNR